VQAPLVDGKTGFLAGFSQREILMMKIAIAVFVKTPGFSPLKTRLAKDIGPENAEGFFKMSLLTIESTLKKLITSHPQFEVYWSVAEREALASSLWSGFPTIPQGSGDLGLRMHTVYRQLIKKYDQVYLIGADSPQLKESIFIKAQDSLSGFADFTIGPTLDGGFYLFGGKKEIPLSIWQAVPYSQSNTFELLLEQLKPLGQTQFLEKNYDVDFVEDLEKLSTDLPQFQIFL
jgi:rSAM/selenodomain-associated transferase 1